MIIINHPDLPAVREFMIDYGLLDAGQQGDSLYLRSYGDAPFSYVTTPGEAAFVGMGFRVMSHAALEKPAARFGAGLNLSLVPSVRQPFPPAGSPSPGTMRSPRTVSVAISARRMARPISRVSVIWPFSRRPPRRRSPRTAKTSA